MFTLHSERRKQMLKYHPYNLQLLTRLLLTQNPVKAGGMRRFYSGIKRRSMPRVLSWTLNNILEGTKKRACSGCDKGNTRCEMHVHWGVFWAGVKSHRREAGKCEQQRHKEKPLQGVSHRFLINAFRYD